MPVYYTVLTLYILMSSADIFCKQFRTRSGPTKRQAQSGSKLFDTLMVFLKEFFEKVDFEKKQQTTKKKREKFPSVQRVALKQVFGESMN